MRQFLRALNPLAALRRQVSRWMQARLPLSDTLLLTQRNVYILPTGAGWMLALTLLVLLLASINFQLNLGYLLTFLLAGSALVGGAGGLLAAAGVGWAVGLVGVSGVAGVSSSTSTSTW